MKVFLAGGSGIVGKRLVPLLIAGGHHVVATTRTPGKQSELRSLGAEPIVLDALDRLAVIRAVASARPDVVVHQMTALSMVRSLRKFDEELAATNRLRTEGTEYLIEAARASGVRRFVAQSYTGWPNQREGGPVKTEDDPLDPDPPKSMKPTLAAIRQLEANVVSAGNLEGIVLRYGSFYGPGTPIRLGGEVVGLVRQRRLPVFGNGDGVWSFVHVDDVARATRAAVEGGPAGIYNIVDDDPARVSVWLPELARIIGAKAPYRLPEWIGRLVIGEAGLSIMTRARGSSNAKAKTLLNWNPLFPTWRDGFRHVLAPEKIESVARPEHAMQEAV